MSEEKRLWANDNLAITKKVVVPIEELDKRVLALSMGPHPFWIDAYLIKMARRKKTSQDFILQEAPFSF